MIILSHLLQQLLYLIDSTLAHSSIEWISQKTSDSLLVLFSNLMLAIVLSPEITCGVISAPAYSLAIFLVQNLPCFYVGFIAHTVILLLQLTQNVMVHHSISEPARYIYIFSHDKDKSVPEKYV